MKVDIETLGPTRRKLHVELPREKINSEIDEICRRLRREVSVPGFRKGKAPKEILLARFEEQVKSMLVSDLLLSELDKIYDERGITPLSPPEIKTDLSKLPIKGDQPWVIEIEVEVKPEIEPPPYNQIQIEKRRPDVPREVVDEYIESLREQHADYSPIQEARPARESDFVKIDLKMDVPGKGISEAEEKDLIIQIGQGQIVKEVEEGLIGMTPGETRKIEARFPKDHYEPVLAGENAFFEVTLKEILERRLPDLDDEFAKELNFESLEQMRSVIWNRLVEEEKSRITSQLYEEVTRQIVEKTDVAVPESILEERLAELIRDIRTGRYGSQEDREKLRDPTQAEDFIASLRQRLIFEIKKAWIFEEIAKREGIEVTDAEVEQALRLEALRRNVDPQRYLSQIKATGRFESIKSMIFNSKICDFLIKNASEKGVLKIHEPRTYSDRTDQQRRTVL